MSFAPWLDRMIDEKGLDTSHVFEVEGPVWGLNIIPFEVVVEAMKGAPEEEQQAMHDVLFLLDWRNEPLMPFFEEMAKRLAL